MYITSYYRLKKTAGFAIETYSYAENEKPDGEFCLKDPIDKDMVPIGLCNGRIKLREMTEEERKEMNEFQNEKSKFLLK